MSSARRRSPKYRGNEAEHGKEEVDAYGGDISCTKVVGVLLVLALVAGLSIATETFTSSSEVQPKRTLSSVDRLLVREGGIQNTNGDGQTEMTSKNSPLSQTDGAEGKSNRHADADADAASNDAPPSTGTAVPGCPKGGYMDASRRKRAEDALEEHFQR